MRKRTILHTLIGIALALATSGYAYSQNQLLSFPERTQVEDSGLVIGSLLTQQVTSVFNGGIQEGTLQNGEFDFKIDLDTEKADLWQNGQFQIIMIGYYGGQVSEYVGDMQFTSNIDAEETIRLFSVYYQHELVDDKLTILGGLHNYNSVFDLLPYASDLFNSSFGVSYDVSQVGPSITPATASPAVVLKANPSASSYIFAGIYDGTSGDPRHSRGTKISFGSDDGIFYAAEAGLANDPDSTDVEHKLGFGYWYHTKKIEDMDGNDVTNNYGVYGVAEHSLYTDCATGQDIGVFLQLGYANPDKNQIEKYVGAGFAFKGLLFGRPDDKLSVGLASAITGSEYRQHNSSDYAETALEITYRAQLLPYMAVRPDLQYVINPSVNPETDNALVGAVRMEMYF